MQEQTYIYPKSVHSEPQRQGTVFNSGEGFDLKRSSNNVVSLAELAAQRAVDGAFERPIVLTKIEIARHQTIDLVAMREEQLEEAA